MILEEGWVITQPYIFIMTFTFSIIILFIIIVLFIITAYKTNVKREQYNKLKQDAQNYTQILNDITAQIEKQNDKKQEIIKQIRQQNEKKDALTKDLDNLINLCDKRNQQCEKLNNKIIQIKKKADQTYEEEKWKTNERVREFKRVAEQSANYFFDNLEKQYQIAEAGHSQKMTRLKEELDGASADLQKLKDTRKAAHEAILKQQEIKSNKENYCLIPSSFELQDIHALTRLRESFHKPRVISMLIWQYYFQPIAKKQFPIILQSDTKIGIYKITNLKTDQSYIGQSVDIYKRFCDHCKAGLGIDTPAGNKLYKSMQEYGLQNFTFELLCQCSKQELDEKEKYFIELYQADLYGYNSTKGNK